MSTPPPSDGSLPPKPPKPKPVSLGEQLRSQRAWNIDRLNRAFMRTRNSRFFDFFTTGTSNRRPEELVDILRRDVFSCKCLVDVRNNPNSRHTPYWNKSNISKLLEDKGVTYLHRPELGVPTDIRKQLYTGVMSHGEFFSWYDSYVLSSANFDEITKLVKDFRATFLCTEVGPEYCHRHRIALKLESEFGYISYDL